MSENAKYFWVRTAVGALLLGLIIALGILGGWYYLILLFVFAFLGAVEFYRVFGMEKALQGVYGLVLGSLFYFLLALRLTGYLLPFLAASFLLLGLMYVMEFGRTDAKKTMASWFCMFYLFGLFPFLFRIRAAEGGKILFFLPFVSAFGADSFAYIFGSLFGKHKMAPVLSPKKSWEGFAGGMAMSLVLGALYGLIFKDSLGSVFGREGLPVFFASPIVSCALLSFLGAFASVIGDLFASAFKREHDVKDYSHFIPGHGGVLDRFDSVLFAAPVVYYLIRFLSKG